MVKGFAASNFTEEMTFAKPEPKSETPKTGHEQLEAMLDQLAGASNRESGRVAAALIKAIPDIRDAIAVLGVLVSFDDRLRTFVHPIIEGEGADMKVTGIGFHYPNKLIERLCGGKEKVHEAIERAKAKGIKFVKDTSPDRNPNISENTVIYPISEAILVARAWMGDLSDHFESGSVNVLQVPMPLGENAFLLMF